MSLIDTLIDTVRPRSARGPSGAAGDQGRRMIGPDGALTEVVPWWQSVVAGAFAALGSWLVLALPALVLWVLTPHTSVGPLESLGVASAGWFVGHGVGVTVGTLTVSLTPLGLWLLALAICCGSARRLLDRTEARALRYDDSRGTRIAWGRAVTRRIVPGFLAGYLGFGVVAWLSSLVSPAHPRVLGVPLLAVVPALALTVALVRRHSRGLATGAAGPLLERLPRPVTRAVGPALMGVALMSGAGLLLVLTMVVARFGTVNGLHAALDPGVVGGVLLVLAQLFLLPNLAVWAVSFLAGPGFQVAAGAPVTLFGATPGLLPMVPALGALPTEGTWSPWLRLLLAAPVLAGSAVAWLACREIPRLAPTRTKLSTALIASALTAVTMALLAALGGGSVGVDRLGAVGANPVLLGGTLLVELALGSAVYVGLLHLWLWFGRRIAAFTGR